MVNPRPQASFALVDHRGRHVTEADFRGCFLLVYFGLTHCKVVCPRSLAKLSQVLEALGSEAGRIAPLYITVDPSRDTPDVMATYLTAYPRFTGLTGGPDAVGAAKAAFKVFSQRRPEQDPGGDYEVAHTAHAFLIGPDGEYRDHFAEHTDMTAVVHRISVALVQG